MVLSPTVRLLVVEPATAERHKLRRLAEAAGFVTDEAGSLTELLGWLVQAPAAMPACVLMSLQLPDGDDHAAIVACQSAVCHPPVIVLRDGEDAEILLAAWSAGAAGFVPRQLLSRETLRLAVERATAGLGPAASASPVGPSPIRVMQVACHDLRNPLSAMTLNANILLREQAMGEERRTKLINRILSSANRMSRMLEDFADYASLARGEPIPMRPMETDVGTIAAEAVLEVQRAHPSRELVLEQHGDLRGRWDPARLRQLMHHLLSSSLRHGQPGATVVVGCTELVSPPEVEIGLGYRLAQAEATPAPADGPAGAAPDADEAKLFVAARIADAHQGSLTVGASDPLGPHFRVRLPKQALASARPGALPA